MKKRFLLKVCCGILALAMLAGCGNSSSSSSGQSSSSTVSTSSAESTPESSETNGTEEKLPLTEQTLPVSDEKVTLSYWRVWSNDYTPDFNEYQVNKEMEELTNVKIEFTTVASSIGKEKFGILLASQDLPDMIENNVAYPGGGEKAISDGIYIDMAPYVADYMPTYRALRESDETVRKITVSDTGKMWGIYPLFCNNDMELCAEPSWIGMVIRQDWLDGLKLEQPHTIDQWHTVLTAFKEQKGAEAPLLLSKTGIMPYDYFLSAFGVKSEFYRDGSTVKYGPIEEGYRQYLELMAQWYEEGLVDQNFISNEITSNAPKDYIATGKSGVATYSWAGTGNYLYETGSSTDANINWQPITGPVLKEGEVCQARNISYIAIQTPVSVTSSCEYPEVAAKWLDYQYTKDGFIANSFALLLNEVHNRAFRRSIQTISYMPYFVSMVVMCGIIVDFTQSGGLISDAVAFLTGGKAQNLLGNKDYFRTIYTVSSIWQGLGYGSIIYLAALSGVNQDLYEAAKIDGAGRWKQTIHVTLPSISSTIVIMFIMKMGTMLSVGSEKVLLLYSPAIYQTADVISTYVYRNGFETYDYGFSTAVGLFNSVVNTVFLVSANFLCKKYTETSLF